MADSDAASTPAASSVIDFYDGFASDYHLVYGDEWDNAVEPRARRLIG